MGDDHSSEGFAWLTKRGIGPGLQPLVLTFGAVGIFLVGLGAYKGGEWIRVLRGGLSDEEKIVEAWGGDPPLVADLNGDGEEDIVGIYTAGRQYLGALDGKTRKVIWRQGPVDAAAPFGGGEPKFGRHGDLLLVNERGRGRLVDLAGKQVGSIDLPQANVVCKAEQPGGPLLLRTSFAEKHLAVDLGARSVKEIAGRRPCGRPMANASLVDPSELPGAAGALWALREGTTTVGLRSDTPSAKRLVAHAAGRADPSWSVELEPGQTLNGPEPRSSDIAGGRVLVGFTLPGKKQQLVAALDLQSGKELWRAPFDPAHGTLHGLVASPSRVYAQVGDFLVVLDAATGKMLFNVGRGRDE